MLLGNVFAQLLPLLALPIVTRIYSPENFGVYGLFLAVFGVFASVACLRFEFAILQAPDLTRAGDIFWGAVLCALLLSVATLIAAIFLVDNNLYGLGWMLLLIPPALFIHGLVQAITYLLNRERQYKAIVGIRIIQSSLGLIFILLFSQINLTTQGLILGHVGGLIGALFFGYFMVRSMVKAIDFKRTSSELYNFSGFALFSSPGALLNNASTSAPLFFVQSYHGANSVGLMNIVNRYVGSPLNLVSSSMSQVLHQMIAANEFDDLPKEVLRISAVLAGMGLVLIISVYFLGDELVLTLLGPSWADAVEVLKILVISLSVRFVVSPLSCVLLLDRFLDRLFKWQLLSLIVTLSVFAIFADLSFLDLLAVYVFADVFLYAIYYVLILFAAKELRGY